MERLNRLIRAGSHAADLNPAQWDILRYLARANRFSRTPAALAEYMSTTRGTVSQTVIALEKKGYLSKRGGKRDGRQVDLELTAGGRALLKKDILKTVAREIDATGEAERLADFLAMALARILENRRGRAFGVCRTCRHFQSAAKSGQTTPAPYYCLLLKEPLSAPEADLICAEQEDGAQG